MKTTAVITSINPPTLAVSEFASVDSLNVIVVGDRKTPSSWQHPGVRFLSLEEQLDTWPELASAVPIDHYSRKLLGYALALAEGATEVVDTDDDNIPKRGYEFPPLRGDFDCLPEDAGFINPYAFFTERQIWPRGLPLRCIRQDPRATPISQSQIDIGVWQGLADGDPDVDAIFRLANDPDTEFVARAPLAYSKGTCAPFNSQNTLIRQELFPLLYLPTQVTFRFTDILRGLVAQPIMWAAGFHLGFTGATVRQVRNDHDLMADFASEVPMHLHAEKVIPYVSSAIRDDNSVQGNLFSAYQALVALEIVPSSELDVLTRWLELFPTNV